jgi:hypothetical protein
VPQAKVLTPPAADTLPRSGVAPPASLGEALLLRARAESSGTAGFLPSPLAATRAAEVAVACSSRPWLRRGACFSLTVASTLLRPGAPLPLPLLPPERESRCFRRRVEPSSPMLSLSARLLPPPVQHTSR